MKNHPHVQHIGGVIIYSKQPEALSGWYGEVLGFQYKKLENGLGYELLFPYDDIYSKNEHYVSWKVVAGSENSAPGRVALVYKVSSLKTFRDELISRKISVGEMTSDPRGTHAILTDCEGNEIILWEDSSIETKQKRARRRTARKLEVMFEFLLFGIVFGIIEDLLAVWLVTGERITGSVIWLVVAIAIPFAIIGEIVADNINFVSIFEKIISRTKRNTVNR